MHRYALKTARTLLWCDGLEDGVFITTCHATRVEYHFRTGGVKRALTGQRDSSGKCVEILILFDNDFD